MKEGGEVTLASSSSKLSLGDDLQDELDLWGNRDLFLKPTKRRKMLDDQDCFVY